MYLLDQHVEVLWEGGCEACNVTLSAIEDQSRGFARQGCGDGDIAHPGLSCVVPYSSSRSSRP